MYHDKSVTLFSNKFNNSFMKILFVSNNLSFGGKERQIVELLNFMAANTPNCFGLCLRENNIQYDINDSQNIRLFIPSQRLSINKLITFQKHVINDFKPNVVHTWEGGVAFTISMLKLLCYRKLPIIDGTLRYSKIFYKSSKYYWIERFNRSVATNVIANSGAGIGSIDYAYGSKYVVIPNCIDIRRFEKYSKPDVSIDEDIFTIGMLANFTKPKDYKSLIKAGILLLKDEENIRFIFIGDGPEKAAIEALIPPSYKEKFCLTGYIKNPEYYIRNFDIGVLLSKKGHSEGMSNAIMEYMAFGLPVVCTDTGGNNELIINNLNGYLINHEDVEGLKSCLTILIRNTELRNIFGSRSYNIVRDNYDINIIFNKYIELYNKVSS
jgi:glycosyltransferase involved in cell wall biosynthesis